MDILFYGGNIITLDPENPSPEAVLVCFDKIYAIGTLPMLKTIATNPTLIDLKGNTLVPAFTDAHTHFVETARHLSYIDLNGCQNSQQLHSSLINYARKLKEMGFANSMDRIKGFGWDKIYFDNDPNINRHLIDSVFPDIPVNLASHDLHSNLCNSEALAMISRRRDLGTLHKAGIMVGRYENGEPNGFLYENSWTIIDQYLPPEDDSLLPAHIKQLTHKCYKYGLCGVHCMEDINAAKVISKMCDSLGFYFTWYYFGLNRKKVSDFDYKKHFLPEAPHFRNGGVKLFSDGSLGSDSAWLFENRTNPIYTNYLDKIRAELTQAQEQGIQVAVHAIGDLAVNTIANMIISTKTPRKKYPKHRIEHLQAVRPQDIKLLKKAGIHASMQPVHMKSDIDKIRQKWQQAQAYSFPVKTIYKNFQTALGSDSPVETLNPVQGMYYAMHRNGFLNNEAITFPQALAGYTYKHHLITNEPITYGQIKKDQTANITVISKDAIKCLTHKSKKRKNDFEDSILLTMIDGKLFYNVMEV